MASLEQINNGDRANDGTGDSIRTAFGKINNNSDTLNNTGIGNTTLTFNGNAISSSTGIDLSQNGGNLGLGALSSVNLTGATADGQFLVAAGTNGGVRWDQGVAGTNQQIQYNFNNRFAGDSTFTYDPASRSLSVGNNITATRATFSQDITVGNITGNAAFFSTLFVSNNLITVNSSSIDAGNLFLVLGNGLGNTSNSANQMAASGGGIQLGSNIANGNINIIYNSTSNAWVFSRPIIAPGGFNSSTQGANIQSTSLEANSVTVNQDLNVNGTAYINQAEIQFANINNPNTANSLAIQPNGGGIVLKLENSNYFPQTGFVGFQLASNTASNVAAGRNGSWNIYTEAITGNLSFVGSYANSNAAVSANGIVFGKDGKIYASGIYDSATGNAISGGNPAGSNYQVQYNFNNQFAANSGLTFNPATQELIVTNINVLGNVLQNNTAIAVGATGYNTTVQYNSNGVPAGSNSFRFLSSSNVVAVAGNIVANSVYSVGTTSITSALGGEDIGAVAYGAGYFVAGGMDGNFAYSATGTGWANTGSSPNPDIPIINLAYLDGYWVSVQSDVTLNPQTQIWSSNLVANNWQLTSNFTRPIFVQDLVAVTLDNQRLMIGVGDDSDSGAIIYGSVANGWVAVDIASTSALYGVDSSGTIAVAVGVVGTGATANAAIYTATQANTWTATTANLNSLYGNSQTLFDVAWGTDRFVAVGDNANVTLYSTDGLSWTAVQSNTNTIFSKIAFSDGLFIAVGNSGRIWTTGDGLSWQSISNGNTQALSDIAVSDSRFVAVGANGTAVTAALTYSYGGYYAGDNAALTGNVSANTFVASGTGNLLVSSPTNIVLQTGTGANVVASGNITTIANVYANNLVSVGTSNLSLVSDANIVLASNVAVSGNIIGNITASGGNYRFITSGNNVIGGNTTISRLATTAANIRLGQNAGLQSNNILSNTAIAIGANAGRFGQGNAIAIGGNAASINQSSNAIAIGANAGFNYQGSNAIAIGTRSGSLNQDANTIAIGTYAGQTSQTEYAIAIGANAGSNSQGFYSVAVGAEAGSNNQSPAAVAVGSDAGTNNQGIGAVAVGAASGQANQQPYAVAVGYNTGQTNQGESAVAVGYFAGFENQPNNTIIINATGNTLNGNTANAFYLAPVRSANATTNVLYYDTTTNEITYGNVSYGNSNVAAYLPTYTGNIVSLTGNVTTTANVTSRRIVANGPGDLLFRSDSNIVLIPNANTNFYTWVTSNLLVSGNTTANYYFGNGAYLTGISGNAIIGGYGNSNVIALLGSNSNITVATGISNISTQGNVTGGNLIVSGANSVLLVTSTSGIVLQPSAGNNVSVIGNVNANFYLGNGSLLTGITAGAIVGGYSNANVANYLPTYTGNITSLTGNITTTANVSASYYLGNGAFLTGISNGGGNYSNANVANYLPTYSGNVGGNIGFTQFKEANVTGGSVSGTITPDAAVGTIYTYTLTGNITLNTISNVQPGTSMTIILQQDATGNRRLTSTWLYASGVKTLSTAANATDIVSVFYSGTQYYASMTRGFV